MTCLTAYPQQKMVRAEAGKTIAVPCERIDSLLTLAMSKKGCPYKWGAAGPNVFDCSGFVMWLYNRFGVSMAHGSVPQYTLGVKVPNDHIRPGDLVFFRHRKCIGHVGLAIAVDSATKVVTFIHASSRRTGVKIDKLTTDHYARSFAGARRIFDCGRDSFDMPEAPANQSVTTTDSVTGVQYETYSEWKTVTSTKYHTIKSGESLSSIAKKYHVTVAELQKWNGLGQSTLIREGKTLKIIRKERKLVTQTRPVSNPTATASTGAAAPQNNANTPAVNADNTFVDSTGTRYERVTEWKTVTYTKTHKIKSGETLSSIAKKYHTTVSKIQSLNKMGSSTAISAGKTLKVTVTEKKPYTVTRVIESPVADDEADEADTSAAAPVAAPAQPAPQNNQSAQPAPAPKPAAQPAPQANPVYYTIKKGDSLGSIAQKYHTTVAKLQKLNKMGSSTMIREGKKIRVK